MRPICRNVSSLFPGVILLLGTAIFVFSCAPKEPVAPVPEDPAAIHSPAPSEETFQIEELYRRLAAAQWEYEESVSAISAGEEVDEEELRAIREQLTADASTCAEMEGCDWGRFLDTMTNLLDQQGRALIDQTSRTKEFMGSVEDDGEDESVTSPLVSALPEMEATISVLGGVDLRELIDLNGHVKAALDDWLTWMRPLLMDSYENYMFLREKIGPVYAEAGLPEALLFAILATETNGKVHSYSRAGAAGPLQFMRHTGRRYGLKVEDGFDMRLDPVAATKANVSYLNDQFARLNNSLEKALAAYNGGENRLRRLHRRFKGASLWDNRIFYSLPRETREYVPRVFAAALLFLHPEDYGLEWPALETVTTQLVLEKDVALGELAICLGQSGNPNGWFRTLRNLNPRVDPGERLEAGKTIEIPAHLVPVYGDECLEGERIDQARLLHEANYPYGEMIRYTVQRGDTLGRIAARFRCSTVRQIAATNNIRPPRYVIHVGQQLRLPDCN